MMFSDTFQNFFHCVSIAARSVASCRAGSGSADIPVGIVAGVGDVVTSLEVTEELGLVDTSATDGLTAADDPEPPEPSAELEVHPATSTATAARHPVMRRSAGRGLFMSMSPRRRSVAAVG